jgi:hypothetical protein
MDHDTARLRSIKTAAIKHFGLDSKKDKEWLDHIAPDYVGEPSEEVLGAMQTRFMDYQLGRERERQESGHRPNLQRARFRENEAPLKPIQDLVKPDDETAERIRAFSNYLARIASVDKNVLRYRKNNLGGFMKTMSEEEAQEWPDHPALLRVCRHLAKHYPWTEDEARYFVLCGAVPQAAKIMGKVQSSLNKPLGVVAHKFNHHTIHLEMPAWMPPELVSKAYMILQRQAHGGRASRRPKERNVALFDFVLVRARVKFVSRDEYLARLELPGTWAELMQEWNGLYGSGHPWHYTHASNFGRDFGRGQQAIAGTKYALSGIPGEPRTVAEAKASFDRLREKLGRPGATFVEATVEDIS